MFKVTRGDELATTNLNSALQVKYKTQTGWWHTSRKSTFSMNVLFVSAFIVIVVFPDIVLAAPPLNMLYHLHMVSALLSRKITFIFDALIYMLTMKKGKKVLDGYFRKYPCTHAVLHTMI